MLTMLTRNWWLVALRGLLAVIFGIITMIWPGLSLTVLVLLFGGYAFVDGVFSLWAGFQQRSTNDRWWALLLEGLVGIGAGILTFLWPDITLLVLLYFIATWAIVTGIFEVVAAIRLRREIEGEWLLALSGILSVIFGILIILFPAAGLVTISWIIAAYAIVFGIVLIILGFRLRSMRDRVDGSMATNLMR